MGHRWSTRPRTFTSVLVRVLVTRVAAFALAAATLALGHLIAVGPSTSASSIPSEEAVRALLSWTPSDAAANPGCVPFSAWPAGAPAEFIVVHSFRDDEHRRMAFATAWAVNHDETEVNDVWVIGVCR